MLNAALQAQSVTYTYGNDLKLPDGHYSAQYFSTGNGITAVSANPESIVIDKLDEGLNVVSSKVLKAPAFSGRASSAEGMMMGDHIYSFYSVEDPNAEKQQIYVQELDPDKGALSGSERAIFSTSHTSGLLWDDYEWSRSTSADNSKVMILHANSFGQKGTPSLEAEVYSDNFKMIWRKQVQLPYAGDKVELLSSALHASGDVYVLLDVVDGEAHRFEILRITDAADKPMVIPVAVPQKYVVTATLRTGSDGRIICAGFYSGSAERISSRGMFLLAIDPVSGAASKLHRGEYDFPRDLVASFENQKGLHKMDKKPYSRTDGEIPVFEIDMSITADGAMTVFGEQAATFSRDQQDPRYGGVVQYNLDIYALHISPGGELMWSKRIPKRQIYGAATAEFGYHLTTLGTDHYLVFPDHEDNLSIADDAKPSTYDPKHGMMVYVRLRADGSVSKGSIFKIRDIDQKFYISKLKDLGKRDIVLDDQLGHRKTRPFVMTIK